MHVADYYLKHVALYVILSLKFYEVKCGMYDSLKRFVGDIDEMSKIDVQIESFKIKS